MGSGAISWQIRPESGIYPKGICRMNSETFPRLGKLSGIRRFRTSRAKGRRAIGRPSIKGGRRDDKQGQERNRECTRHRSLGKGIMSNGLESALGCILMAAISLPLSFYLARGCLRGLLRLLNGSQRRDML